MPSSVTTGPAIWMDGPTYNGANLRPIFSGLLVPSAIQVMSGILPGGGAWSVSPGSGMQVIVGTGTAVIASSVGVTDGGYICTALTTSALTVAGSDPVNPRIDLVCATANDLGNSSSAGEFQIIAGVPAAIPAAPSLPPNSLALAQVLVPALSSSVSSGNITDERMFTVLHGGIIPVPNLTSGLSPLTGYQGQYAHDRSTGRLVRRIVSS